MIHFLSRAVIIKDNHLLVAFDPRPRPFHYYEPGVRFYYLPGGHIETAESPKDALFRELKEELGMLAVIGEFLGKFSNSWGFFGDDICCHTHEINFIFKAEIKGLSALQIPKQQEEHVAFGWIDLNNLSHTDLRPSFLKKNIHGI